MKNRIQKSGELKYTNAHYGFPVVTSQEQSILLNKLIEVQANDGNRFEITYSTQPQDKFITRAEALGESQNPYPEM